MGSGVELPRRLSRGDILQLRSTMAGLGASTGQTAAAIAAALGVNMRVAFRLALGLTQDGIADLYNQLWPSDKPKTGKYISYWERWDGPGSPASPNAREPSYTDIIRLAQIYRCLIDDLIGTPTTAAATGDEGNATNRRTAIRVGLLSATTPWINDLVAPPAAGTGPTETGTGPGGTAPLPLEVVDSLDVITDQLRRMDDQLGGGALLALVHQHAASAVDLLNNRHYSDVVGRRLHSAVAELLRLAGFLSFDTSAHAQAQRYWSAALRAAYTAGDRALTANILGFLSCQAKDLGRTREAITLAETARNGYPGASPQVTAILHLRVAEAHANDDPTSTRTVVACRRAIDAAFDALGDSPASSGAPAWCYWMTEAQAHAQAGYCYLRLGDHARARAHLRSGLRLQESTHSREGALRHVLLATTYVQQPQPDIDKALEYGDRAVDALTGQVDSPRCVGHISRLVKTLKPYGSPEVHAFVERARPLIQAKA
ncbi:hypothetical protein Pth03_44460 [Planotetraspora thailandica]|uniref:Transcriptional regulator n=1 Tax=Planotetraspora thailandica TaxID=487172 RepID=A0A8J3V2C5_9ACTN|nr:hypothetical protein [Planotetraspora thailandica]GII56057.1 hypothetical protein Pth03_44460 [Planotetraspora thailandica]